jgi:hypothetical protein
MKSKLYGAMLATAVLFGTIPGVVSALPLTAPITISNMDSKEQGSKVLIQGTAASAFKEMIVRVIAPDQSVLYYDVIDVLDGQYSVFFTLPVNALVGKYQVTVGQGLIVQHSEFFVRAREESVPAPPVAAPVPAAGQTVLPVDGDVGTSATFELNAPAEAVQQTAKQESGKTVVEAKIDHAKLDKYVADSLQALNSTGTAEAARPKVVVLEVKGQADMIKTGLIVNTFKSMEQNQKSSSMQVKSELGSVVIPAQAVTQQANALGLQGETPVTVTVSKVDPASEKSFASSIQAVGAEALVTPVDFKIETDIQGKTVELNNFDQFIEHKLTLPPAQKDTNIKFMAGLLIDPQTNTYYPMPTWFTKKQDGDVDGTILRKGNSIYTIVKNDKTFTDISGSYAKETIEWLANRFIVNGYENGEFLPDRQITRAEFAALLVRSMGIVPDANPSRVFTDVQPSDWYAGVISSAVKAGFIEGYEDGTFKPTREVTRQEMVQMSYKAMKMAGYSKTLSVEEKDSYLRSFRDQEQIPGWASEAIAAFVRENIVNGMADGSFQSAGVANRAQSVTVLHRMMKQVGFIN